MTENAKKLIDKINELQTSTNDTLLKRWYNTTVQVIAEAAESIADYDEAAYNTLCKSLQTLYPNVDVDHLDNATFSGVLETPANVIKSEILKLKEQSKPKSEECIDAIYSIFFQFQQNPLDLNETVEILTAEDDEVYEDEPIPKSVEEEAPVAPVIDRPQPEDDPQYKPIDWFSRIDKTKYSIRIDGKVYNNHAGGKEVLSFMKGVERCVKLKTGKHQTTVSIYKLMEQAFPTRVLWRNPDKRTVNLESVTKPLIPPKDLINTETLPEAPLNVTVPEKKEDEFVWIDWLKGIPKKKYQLYPNGKIFNIVDNEELKLSNRGSYKLSSFIGETRKRGVKQVVREFTKQTMIWFYYHPEDRSKNRLRLRFKDENPENMTIENLELAYAVCSVNK